MDALEKEIIEFVVRERRKKPEAVSLDSHLQDDLGLEGDDAVELFKHFEKKFATDCSALWSQWDNHFIPEGGSGGTALVAAIILLGVGLGLKGFMPPILRWSAGILMTLVWFWLLMVWPKTGRKLEPITIRMMADAARAKRWPSLS